MISARVRCLSVTFLLFILQSPTHADLPADWNSDQQSLQKEAISNHIAGRYREAANQFVLVIEKLRIDRDTDQRQLAEALYWSGKNLTELRQFADAIVQLQEALLIYNAESGDKHLDTLNAAVSLGVVLVWEGKFTKAEELLKTTLQGCRELPPGNELVLIYCILGFIDAIYYGDESGWPNQELETLSREVFALASEHLAEDHHAYVRAVLALASFNENKLDVAEAERNYREALRLARLVYPANHPMLAYFLSRFAWFYQDYILYANYSPENIKTTESLLLESLAIEQLTFPQEDPLLSNGGALGALYTDLGRYHESEQSFRRSISNIVTHLGSRSIELLPNYTAYAYLKRTIGDYEGERALVEKALAIDPQYPPALSSLAILHSQEGNYTEAERIFRELLSRGFQHNKNFLAIELKLQGKYEEAELLFTDVLEEEELPWILVRLAELKHETNRVKQAEEHYIRALQITQSQKDIEGLARVQHGLAKLLAGQQRTALAILFGKLAVNNMQTLREGLAKASVDTQQKFLASREEFYRALIASLLKENRTGEAKEVLEMLKLDEYLAFVRFDSSVEHTMSKLELNELEQGQLARYNAGSANLGALAQEYQTLSQIDPFELSNSQEERLAVLELELHTAQENFVAALEAIKNADSGGTKSQVGQNLVLQGKDDRGLIRDIGEDVALLHTVFQGDMLYLLLTLPAINLSYKVDLPQESLHLMISQFRKALQDIDTDPRPLGKTLHSYIIEPVAADLEAAGIKNLMVSLDGQLRYLPLGALHDGNQYLVEQYAISIFTDVARENLKEKPSSHWRGIGLGVSQAQAQVGPDNQQFAALAMVPVELDSIIKDQEQEDEKGVIPGRYFLDESFTEDTFRRSLRYPVVHVASHFRLYPGNETMSFMLLGDGNVLDMRAIRENNFDFGSVELMTLSACETAVSSTNASGQELEGFAALVQKKGAKSVIATLWQVADESTSKLMSLFYELRERDNLTKIEALRQSKLALLGPNARAISRVSAMTMEDIEDYEMPEFEYDPERPFEHPFYWAPFILMGNWL